MKLNLNETHDRYLEFKKQSDDISQFCQNIILQRPFGKHPFYIFVHGRTLEDKSGSKLIWQTRLSKPRAQTNSMLFKAYPGTENLKIMWLIPKRELWKQYKEKNITASPQIVKSIHEFITNKAVLETAEPDDYDNEKINAIYQQISKEANNKKCQAQLGKPQNTII